MNLLQIQPHKISKNLNDKIYLFYGEPSTRKTSVACSFDNSILAAFEIGYKFISGVIAQPISKWGEFKAFIRELQKQDVKDTYKTVVIDTVTLAYSACSEYILGQFGVSDPGDIGFGKGWRAIRKEFEKTILSIPQMGYGLILIAHADEMGGEDGNVKAKVDIDKRPAAIIKGLADFIFYTRKEYRDEETESTDSLTVYAYTKLSEIETKSRSRYLSPRFEFTYENLEEEMRIAIEKQEMEEGITTVDETENLHEVQVEDFNQLKLDVIELATELVASPAKEQVELAIMDTLGFKITDAAKIHMPKLEALEDKLKDIKAQLAD